MFGTISIAAQIDSAIRFSVKKYNEQVTKNRRIRMSDGVLNFVAPINGH